MAGRPQPLSRWVWLYIICIIALGTFTLYSLRPRLDALSWVDLVAFAGIVFVTEAMPVELPRRGGTLSVGFAVIYAALLVMGPEVATWLAALATVRTIELSGRVSLEKALFNRAQLALSAAAAGLSYVALGGVPGRIDIVTDALPLGAAASAYLLVNMTTVVVVMCLTQKVSFWRIWVTNIRWMVPHYLALTPLGLLIGFVRVNVGLVGVFLLLVPLVVARYSLQLYVQMRRAYFSTIQAMVAAIEARDPYTAGHSRRVSAYTVVMARALRLPEDQVERLEYAAWLHDIGKLAVPDHILRKRGTLSAEEWEQMKRHPETGANILKQIKLLGRDVNVIHHHHERWNGEGYPDFLKGADIPLGARLIALADAFEAMTSARPYRARPLTKEEALTELRRGGGTQFDPALVETLVSALAAMPLEEEEAEPAPAAPFRRLPAPPDLKAGYREAAAAGAGREGPLSRLAELAEDYEAKADAPARPSPPVKRGSESGGES